MYLAPWRVGSGSGVDSQYANTADNEFQWTYVTNRQFDVSTHFVKELALYKLFMAAPLTTVQNLSQIV